MGLDFVDEATEKGVTERRFDLKVGEEVVPGILWTPEGATGPRPLILAGHGGSQHKRIVNILGMARSFVRHRGWAVAAIDAPQHGERTDADEAPRARLTADGRLQERAQMSPEEARAAGQRFKRAVLEWQATLDALQEMDEIGVGAVGYWGVSMGTLIGLPFCASEPRIRCAVLGLAGLRENSGKRFTESARNLAIPVLFVYQRHDELGTIEQGLALYDALGSALDKRIEKTMHINPGSHVGMPRFERDAAEAFFARHLLDGGADVQE